MVVVVVAGCVRVCVWPWEELYRRGGAACAWRGERGRGWNNLKKKKFLRLYEPIDPCVLRALRCVWSGPVYGWMGVST